MLRLSMVRVAPALLAALAASSRPPSALGGQNDPPPPSVPAHYADPPTPPLLPRCPRWTDGSVPVPVEHGYDVCDVAVENDPDVHASRMARARVGAAAGHLQALEDDRTWLCPPDGAGAGERRDGEEGGTPGSADWADVGPPAKWIVRNRASTPVSVALVDSSRGGEEVSALNRTISPAHADPDAVLQPGRWRSVDVVLGTVLHVRELIQVGSELAPGRVLLRHRPGPIAIKDRRKGPTPRFAGDVVPAPKPKRTAPPKPTQPRQKQAKAAAVPRRNLQPKKASRPKAEPKEATPDPDPEPEDTGPPLTEEEKAAREASRPKFSYDRRCNSLNRLFVNRAGRAVEVHYAGVADAESLFAGGGGGGSGADCLSRLAFHLGTSLTARKDYLDLWDSAMSYESTYTGHRFVARLSSDPSVVVDEIYVGRTDVADCPYDREATASVGGEILVRGYEAAAGSNATVARRPGVAGSANETATATAESGLASASVANVEALVMSDAAR